MEAGYQPTPHAVLGVVIRNFLSSIREEPGNQHLYHEASCFVARAGVHHDRDMVEEIRHKVTNLPCATVDQVFRSEFMETCAAVLGELGLGVELADHEYKALLFMKASAKDTALTTESVAVGCNISVYRAWRACSLLVIKGLAERNDRPLATVYWCLSPKGRRLAGNILRSLAS